MSLLSGTAADCQFDILRERQPDMRSVLRSSVVVLSLAAWFTLSNHCVLGAMVTESRPAMNGCPMHSAPVKKKPAAETPCCKEVRAIVAKTITAATMIARSIVPQPFTAQLLPSPLRLPTEVELLDTGPPGRSSFAEAVLQESMLAHAPPVS